MTDPDAPFPCVVCPGTCHRIDVSGQARTCEGLAYTLPPGSRRWVCDRCGDVWLTMQDADEETAAMVAATRRLGGV